jgi:hypothetical protein
VSAHKARRRSIGWKPIAELQRHTAGRTEYDAGGNMMNKGKKETRSPIKAEEKPLRNPGESLEQELNRLFDEEIFPYTILVVLMIFYVIYEWLRWILNPPPQPVVVTLLAALVIIFSIFKVHGFRKQVQNLKNGIEGEKTVGQYLERLRSQGYLVFHDVPGERFNIDHVIVSTHGVFTVETKTLSKPIKGNPTVTFDGERILVNGFEPDRNPVTQALAERSWLQNLFVRTTGKSFPVKAIVVFPGWYVEPQKSKKDEIWVLNHKALPKFIENEPSSIRDEDVSLLSSRLSDYIHSQDAKQAQK